MSAFIMRSIQTHPLREARCQFHGGDNRQALYGVICNNSFCVTEKQPRNVTLLNWHRHVVWLERETQFCLYLNHKTFIIQFK